MGIAFAIALVFLPKALINADEIYYTGEARALLHGHLVPTDGDAFPTPLVNAGNEVRYPLGWPILLAPAAAIGFRAMYLVALAVHLFGGLVVGRLFVRRGLPSWLAAVYLFHPLFWSFSRTLMSDLPAAVLLLAGIDAWEEQRPGQTALAFAYSFLVRHASAMALAGIGLAILPDAWRRRKDVLFIGVACVAAIGIALVVNRLTHGNSTQFGYSHAAQNLLNGRAIGENLVLYVGGALVIPPFPLLCILLRRRDCDRWILAAIPIVAFFTLYEYHDKSSRWLETLLGGQRLVLAAHAILLVATAKVWSRVPLLRVQPLVLAGGAAAAVGACLAVQRLEHRYGDAAQAIAACKPARVAFNGNASRAALSVDAEQFHLVDGREPSALGDVVLISEKMTSNRPGAEGDRYIMPDSLRSRSDACRQVGEFYLFDIAGRCPPAAMTCNKTVLGRAD
ncbi:MAG TPA: hypothetical protein VNO21_14345 [Polyangiaceae bacterium]|nr:hypothetical protein [Polyangiaceae bacterium]